MSEDQEAINEGPANAGQIFNAVCKAMAVVILVYGLGVVASHIIQLIESFFAEYGRPGARFMYLLVSLIYPLGGLIVFFVASPLSRKIKF